MTKQAPNRIRALRKEVGLTQRVLAEELGVMRQTVSNWERGVDGISPSSMGKLAHFFQVSAGYLLGLTNDKTDPSDLNQWIAYQTRR